MLASNFYFILSSFLIYFRVIGNKGKLESSKCTYYNYNYTEMITQNSINATSIDITIINAISESNVTSCDSWIFDDSIYNSTAVTEVNRSFLLYLWSTIVFTSRMVL